MGGGGGRGGGGGAGGGGGGGTDPRFRSWARTRGCAAVGRSADTGRGGEAGGGSPFLLEPPALLLLEGGERVTQSPVCVCVCVCGVVWCECLTHVCSSCVLVPPPPSSIGGSSGSSPDRPMGSEYPSPAPPHQTPPSSRVVSTTCCLYCCTHTHSNIHTHISTVPTLKETPLLLQQLSSHPYPSMPSTVPSA